MSLPRFLRLYDVGVVAVFAVALLLPPRVMYASDVVKGDDAARFAIALAEARTIARPDDGLAVEDLGRKLGEAGLKDWAIEATVRASERAKGSPTRWRALIAASVAYVDMLEVVPALDYANRALASCESTRERGDAAGCPSWEEVRMRLYQQNLDAGVKSGIDPKVDVAGFRNAGQAALRHIYIGGRQDRVLDGQGGSASPASPSRPGEPAGSSGGS